LTRASFFFRFSKKWIELLCLVLLFGWAFFLFTRYFSFFLNEFTILKQAFSVPYGFSLPLNAQWLPAFWFFLKITGTALAIGFVTFRLGFFLRKWLRFTAPNRLMGWAIDFGLGVFLIDLLWLGLGFNQLWYTSILWFCFGFLFLVCVIEKAVHFSALSRKGVGIPDWPYGFLAIAGLAYWLFSFLHGLLPETHTDGLNYHLGTPCYWLMRHGIRNFTSYYEGFPYGGELFLSTGYLFQGTEAAKLLNVLVFGVCTLAAAGWAQDAGGKNAGWLAFGLTLTSPLLALVSWTTQIESFLVLFSILFFYGLYRLIKTDAFNTFGSEILLTGLWGGMTLSVKYTGILGVGVGLLLFPFFFKESKIPFKKKNYFILLILILMVDAVWLLKNWIFVGNPLAPYFKHLFYGNSALWWNVDIEDVNPDPWHWYRLVWTSVMSKPSLYSFAGPLVLLFIPVVFLFRTENREWKWVGWSLAVLCPICLMFLTILKFHLPEIILFYIFCSVLFTGQKSRYWGKFIALSALVSAIFCFPYLAGMSAFYYSGLPIWTARENHDQYLERRLPYYESCEFVSKNLPQESRLLLIGAEDVYFDRPSYQDWEFFNRLFQTAGSVSEAFSRVRQAGFTHVVLNLSRLKLTNSYLNFTLSPAQWRLFDDYFRRGLEPVYEKGPVAIFRICSQLKPKGDPSPVDPFLFCSQPASRFLAAQEAGDLARAQLYLNQAVQLYPFSDYWKTQQKRLRDKKSKKRMSKLLPDN